ncbi:uncharacterized protein LOC135342184 [Halichondria panicea]|uniref:uncharacterized protein LOC135342184 n=1 Tax=Halichondria panicea TaxID=6063 RepID=UPI00312B6E6D
MFQEFRKHIPSLSPWIEACYSSQPNLLLGSHSLLSCSGVQQGDPLGPLGFALTLQPIIDCIQSEVPGLALNAWYLDDGTLIGSPNDLLSALEIIEREGPRIGLHLNKAKSLLYIPAEADQSVNPLPSAIPIVREGFSLLGCPVGPPDFCEASFQTRIDKIKLSLNLLHTLEDSQAQTTLLRSCLALPKVVSVLRACPPGRVGTTAHDFDCSIRRALESILGGPLSDWSWQKASLPCSKGGLGLRSAPLHAPAAYLDSSLRSAPLVEGLLGRPPPPSIFLDETVSAIASSSARPDWQTLNDIDIPLRQGALSAAIDESVLKSLLASAPTTRSRALALSTGLPHAHDWLNVIPSPSLGLHLQDREFRSCLCYWLGVPLHNDQFTCPECHGVADSLGDHQVGCGGNSDRISRHNAVRDVVFKAAQSAALGPSRETTGLVPDSASRPADALLPNWINGRPAALDVHVISPLQSLTLSEAARTQGHALQVGVQRKLASNLPSCRSVGMTCIPLVAETLGGLAEDFISTIRDIGRSICLRSGADRDSVTIKHLFGRVSIALWRGNASMLIHRSPTLSPVLDGHT